MTIGRIPSVEGGIQPTIVDAKGDLIAATAADTVNRLAVGDNDQVLVADSSTSTGLAWKSVATPFAAGKNKIINGDFNVNQRSFSSTTSSSVFTFDRWKTYVNAAGTSTFSAQTFTPGTAPVAGYEGRNFLQIATTGQSAVDTATLIEHPIESVRTLAGQTATVSFWARATSGTPSVATDFVVNFGTGGSPSTAFSTGGQKTAITTSWARYSFQVSIPSLSGKTIGTNNNDCLVFRIWTSAGSTFNAETATLGIQTTTIQIWGVQVEAGPVATPFQTATGTLQGELAACQRYCYVYSSGSLPAEIRSSTSGFAFMKLPVTMRTSPVATYAAAGSYSTNSAGKSGTLTSISTDTASPDFLSIALGFTAYTAGQAGTFFTSGSTTISAEL